MLDKKKLIQLVEQAKEGDADALETLYRDSGKSIYYLALKTLKDTNDAEDIAQEVFITVQEKISDLHEPAAYYKWVNQITVNKCTDLLRRRRVLSFSEEFSDEFGFEEEAALGVMDKGYEEFEIRQLIMTVIDDLPVDQRVCVMMYYYQQSTIAQIAESLEIKETTVKNRLALARGKIRAELERKEREEGIKLWVFPIPLTPILRQAMENFHMPEDVSARIWQNVSQSISSGASGSATPNQSGGGAGTPVQATPMAEAAGTAAAASTGAAAATGMTLITKIIIGVVAVVVIAAGAVFLPSVFDGSDSGTAIVGAPIQDGYSEATEVTLLVNGTQVTATYEGEYANGLFNGYGIWEYNESRTITGFIWVTL